MFDRYSVIFKHLKYFPTEADLGVHHCFFNSDRGKAVCAGNTCDRVFRLAACAFDDKSTFVFRLVRIADIDRDARLAYREDRILVKYAGSHVGQLAQLFVGDRLDRFRVLDDPRICDQESGYICPVLIEICSDRKSYQRTCDIRTAAGKCHNLPVSLCAVESRDHCGMLIFQLLREKIVCDVRIE